MNDQGRGIADPAMFVSDLRSLRNTRLDQYPDLIGRQVSDHLLANIAGQFIGERCDQSATTRLGALINIRKQHTDIRGGRLVK
jgi:hypothetical protein